jgi:hypothetical protein
VKIAENCDHNIDPWSVALIGIFDKLAFVDNAMDVGIVKMCMVIRRKIPKSLNKTKIGVLCKEI